MATFTFLSKLRYLLLQVRNPNDPMRTQEVDCFAQALHCRQQQIDVFDLLSGVPGRATLDRVDMVLLGGSGDYSVGEGGPWLPPALEAMGKLCNESKPTFASCWGFQAMARALGGQVVTDPARAEVGTHRVHLTPAGQQDPVFAPLGNSFLAQMGHQDIVDRLPVNATLLASTGRVANQAFRLQGKPIYCTQFHPELTRQGLVQRLWAYPQYVVKTLGIQPQQFADTHCHEAPESNTLLLRFVHHVFG